MDPNEIQSRDIVLSPMGGRTRMGYLVILLKESIMGLDYMWGMVEMMHLDNTRAWTTHGQHI